MTTSDSIGAVILIWHVHATWQATEDRGHFNRLDGRLSSPFVLTLLHLGEPFLGGAGLEGAGGAVVGGGAQILSLAQPLLPVPLSLRFVLEDRSQTATSQTTSCCVCKKCILPLSDGYTIILNTQRRSDNTSKPMRRLKSTFIFLRCLTFGTFLLAGRTILSALTHSSYLKGSK